MSGSGSWSGQWTPPEGTSAIIERRGARHTRRFWRPWTALAIGMCLVLLLAVLLVVASLFSIRERERWKSRQ